MSHNINQFLCRLFSAVLLLSNAPCRADFHGTLTATTNYADRWFSKTDNKGALIANLDYEHSSGFYVGSSVANVEFEFNEIEHQAAHVEVTPYLGWSFNLPEQLRLDVQWTGYLYDGDVFGHAADYHEFYVFLHYRDLISAHIAIAHDYYGLGNHALDYALTGRYPITDALQLSANIGYARTQTALGSDYPYWALGLSYAFKFTKISLRYLDATETASIPGVAEAMHARYDPPIVNKTFIFSISAGF